MKNKHRVAIIGAGRIGSTFDSPTSEYVLTHAHAFSRNNNTELVAFVECDRTRGKEEAEKWNTLHFEDVESMFNAVRPDIVVIATPDQTHIPLLQSVVHLQPKLIICEKPVQLSVEDGERVRSIETTIPIIINYRRRFDSTVKTLRNSIVQGDVGEVLAATGIFSGGFLHNGSHLIDLARFLFGEMTSSSTKSFVSFQRCPKFHILESDSTTFSIFELDILTEKGRFRFIDEGFVLQTQEVINDPVFIGDKMLGPATEEKTELIGSMEALTHHSIEILGGSDNSVSSLENALKTEETCFTILTST